MRRNTQNTFSILISNWIAPRLDKLETILGLSFLVGLILKMYSEIPSFFIIYLSLAALATVYFFNASSMEGENTDAWARIVNRLSSWGCSVACLGILFLTQNYPGSLNMISISSVTLILMFAAMVYLNSKLESGPVFGYRSLLRVLIIGLLGFALYFTPTEKLEDIGLMSPPEIEVVD